MMFYTYPNAVLFVCKGVMHEFRTSHVDQSFEHLLWSLVTGKHWRLFDKRKPALLWKFHA